MASSAITSWQIDGETMETVTDFIFLGSKITTDSDCSLKIKRHMLLGRKTMTKLVQFSSATKPCMILCDPIDCSMPGFPVCHQLLELAHTHVHGVSDAIQPSGLLLYPSLPAFNPSQHQGLSNEWVLWIRWPKYWSFNCSISNSNEYAGLIFLRIDWFGLLAIQGTL